MISDEGNSLIESTYIKKMRETPERPIESGFRPKWIMVTCDPNAGGPNDMSLVAMINAHGQRWVSTNFSSLFSNFSIIFIQITFNFHCHFIR
jgi:hypothetical protein